MKAVVLDASAAAAWVLPDEPSDVAHNLYAQARVDSDRFHAPALWLWETGNLLVMGALRRRIPPHAVAEGLQLLAAAHINFDPPPDSHRRAQTARLAAAHGLTFYDAAYLELVLRLNGQLATRDKKLLAAAKTCGIVCLAF